MKEPISKISVEQKQVIIEFMEQNIDFAQGTALKVKNRPTYNELWNQLTLILNKSPGPKKDKIKWQKVWSGIKKGIKMKLNKIQIYQDKNTGQCIFYPRLTDIDERIIAIMKNKSEKNKETTNENNQNKKTVDIPTEKKVNKMKNENSPNSMHLQKMNQSSISSLLMEQMIFSDDEEYPEETTYEECSNFSWNSHDNRSTKENENTVNTIMLGEKMDAVSLQLEQLIEQNSVSNILLERIATTLEKRNTQT